MNKHAQELFCTLQTLFTGRHQRASFTALLALFLKGDGCPTLRCSSSKSPAALSRFLNFYTWNARGLIRATRAHALESLFAYYQQQRGRRPYLLVSVDLTTLEKVGCFEKLGLISVLNKKRGLHLVVLYLVAGPLRFPWAFRVWRGKNEASVSELALALLRSLPRSLTTRFKMLVLADGGFGNKPFLEGVRKLGLDAVVGMRQGRHLEDGRQLNEVRSGERVTPTGLSYPVTVARYYLKRDTGRETRFVVATFSAKAQVVVRWGKRRWCIEAFFKTAKSRFGLARFAQQTRLGTLRFLLLSLLSFVLVQSKTWTPPKGAFPAWQTLARDIRRLLVPQLARAELLIELERLEPYLKIAVEGLP